MRSLPIRALTLAAAGICALSLTSCAGTPSTSPSSETTGTAGQSVSYGMMPSQGPNWLGPFNPADKMITANSSLHQLLWVPLFQYDGASGTMEWDKAGSVASDYSFSSDGLTVTITLGSYNWADGQAVTTRDVEFDYNLIKNNTDQWGSYSQGLFPDNVTAFNVIDDTHLSLTFDKVYNPDWIVANQLTYLVPLPQHVMDITSVGGTVGDNDRTAAGAQAVYNFLQDQGKDISSYSTNPLWQAVDGPYTVQSWTTDGAITIVANTKYTGTDKPAITTVNFKPYTSDDAEMNDVRAKALDYGYITAAQMASQSQFTSLGYQIVPWAGWGVTYAPYNFANPTTGPIFSQLYVRQGLQLAIDQPTMVDKIFYNTATPDYGPVPQGIPSSFLSDVQKNNPYPYDLTKAAASFTDNGWTKGSDGTLACTSPGTGAGQCGDGIAAGTKMDLDIYTENADVTTNEWSYIKSQWAQIGVNLTIDSTTSQNVLTRAQECKTSNGATCTWDMVFFGTAGSWYFSPYPTGDHLWAENVKWNCGQYVDQKAFDLIAATLTSTDTSAGQAYSAYLAQQLPVLWMPMPAYQISVITSGLNVGTQDPGTSFMPQRWSWAS